MKANQWIVSGDTGVSSKTIWAVMMGAIPENPRSFDFDTPCDPDDFGRCYRLLNHIPEWKDRLSEVSAIFPKWRPMVREWDKMTKLYEKELPSGSCPELYNLMKDLREEGMGLDGWVKTGPCSWKKESGK